MTICTGCRLVVYNFAITCAVQFNGNIVPPATAVISRMACKIVCYCFLFIGILSHLRTSTAFQNSGASGNSGSSSGSGSCPTGWIFFQTRCYRPFDSSTDSHYEWDAARGYCGGLAPGADLATLPDSAADAEALRAEFSGGAWSGNVWVGGRQQDGEAEPDGGWQWWDGSAIQWTNWETGQPDNNADSDGTGAACLFLDSGGKWHDGLCAIAKKYLCQMAALTTTTASTTTTLAANAAGTTTTNSQSTSSEDGTAEALTELILLLEDLLYFNTAAASQLTDEEVRQKLLNVNTVTEDADGQPKSVSFLSVVQEPPLAMGIFTVDSSYIRSRPPAAGAEVDVVVDVRGVTTISSQRKVAGLNLALTFAWQDNRLNFTAREPAVNEEFEFSPALLK